MKIILVTLLQKNHHFEIEITNEENFIIFDIKETCNLKEYLNSIEKIDTKGIDKEISNNFLFDGTFNKINKKRVYIYINDNIKYNIYFNNEEIAINERINTLDLENGFIDERILRINKKSKDYKITRLKHDKIKSTFYVKTFSSLDPNENFFHLDKKEALILAREILENISKVPNIKKIINFEEIIDILSLEEKNKLYSTITNNIEKFETKENNNVIKKELKNNLYF